MVFDNKDQTLENISSSLPIWFLLLFVWTSCFYFLWLALLVAAIASDIRFTDVSRPFGLDISRVLGIKALSFFMTNIFPSAV